MNDLFQLWNSYDARIQDQGVSEWLLLNANSVIIQLYHGENKLIFNEMMITSGLY
jgi:ribosomal silencing factor RsfS